MITYNNEKIASSSRFDLLPLLVSGDITYIGEGDLKGITSLKANAFRGCTKLKKVTFSKNLTTIEESAFENCTDLVEIYWSENLESIGSYAFRNCNKLESMYIPDSVVSVGLEAFRDCSSLSSVVIGKGIKILSFWMLSNTALEEVTVPDNVETIWDNVFRNCSKLKTVTIGRGIKTIRVAAFIGSPLIETFTILADDPPSLDISWGFIPKTAVIRVPAQSLEKYKTATNWAAYADQFVGIEV